MVPWAETMVFPHTQYIQTDFWFILSPVLPGPGMLVMLVVFKCDGLDGSIDTSVPAVLAPLVGLTPVTSVSEKWNEKEVMMVPQKIEGPSILQTPLHEKTSIAVMASKLHFTWVGVWFFCDSPPNIS